LKEQSCSSEGFEDVVLHLPISVHFMQLCIPDESHSVQDWQYQISWHWPGGWLDEVVFCWHKDD